MSWDWPHLQYVRKHLDDSRAGLCNRIAVSWPPQHGKTESVTVRYPLYLMLAYPGIRVAVASYNQRFTNKQSRKTRRLARQLGIPFGDVDMVDEWNLANGSTFVSKGAGVGIAGEPVDIILIDDPFKNRKDADSVTIQERVYDWYMDDVTPRIQKGGVVVIIHTRWGPGDLIGRIQQSEEGGNWRYVVLPAIALENDPMGRAVGEALCPDRFTIEDLMTKRRILGIGFESLYQQNPIPRGGTFFQRSWFEIVDHVPADTEWIRYWDLAASREDTACYTSGTLLGRFNGVYFIGDITRGRYDPASRNDVMLQTALGDSSRGEKYKRTYFEKPVFDKQGKASKAIISKLAGLPVSADDVGGKGSKELRAEPLADAAKAGLVKILRGSWNAAFLTEIEGFPRATYKDQVDSTSGAFNMLTSDRPAIKIARTPIHYGKVPPAVR